MLKTILRFIKWGIRKLTTYLPNGLELGVPATEDIEAVRLSQLEGTAGIAPVAPRCIYNNQTQYANVGTNPETVYTFTPAFTPAAGDRFLIRVFGTFAANGNAKGLALTTMGLSGIGMTRSSTGSGSRWEIEFEAMRPSSSNTVGNQRGFSVVDTDVVDRSARVTNCDWSAFSIVMSITGTAANDIFVNGMTVDYIPSTMTV